MSDFSFVPLRPFFCAALAKRWKVQFQQGFAYFDNNVDSKQHVIIRTAILYNEINSGLITKKTLYIYMYVRRVYARNVVNVIRFYYVLCLILFCFVVDLYIYISVHL